MRTLYGVNYRNRYGKLCSELTIAPTKEEAVYKAAVQLEQRGAQGGKLEEVYIEGKLK